MHDHEIKGASEKCACETRLKEGPNQAQTDKENNSSHSSPAAVNTGDHGLIPSSSRSDEADHDHEISVTKTQLEQFERGISIIPYILGKQ